MESDNYYGEVSSQNNTICKDEVCELALDEVASDIFDIEERTQGLYGDFNENTQNCDTQEKWLREGELFIEETDVTHVNEIREQTTQEEGVSQDVKHEARGIMFKDKELLPSDMYICELCHRVFRNQYKLDSHIYQKHPTKLPAKEKSKTQQKKLKNKDDWPPNVQKLARRVNGEKIFFCNRCPYSVNRCDSMNKHMLRIHSDGRVVPQYQCEVCGKVFVDKAYLRNHGVSHVTERMYSCEVCGRNFHRQPSLKRHLQIHFPDKQYSCTLCDYETNRKHLMYKHIEHHKTGRAYTCAICGSQFFTQMSFRCHLYTHNVTTNSCSFCKVGFSSKERMICHMQKLHFACEIKDLQVELKTEIM